MRNLWNRPALPVWSVSTVGVSGVGNMNIATYVTAVSMSPKLMTVAVYTGTQTLENCTVHSEVLLQLLSEELAPVVRVCGQMSGKNVAKLARLQKRYDIQYDGRLPYFATACGYVRGTVISMLDVAGDHILVTIAVTRHKNLHDSAILTTAYLREHKYTR